MKRPANMRQVELSDVKAEPVLNRRKSYEPVVDPVLDPERVADEEIEVESSRMVTDLFIIEQGRKSVLELLKWRVVSLQILYTP